MIDVWPYQPPVRPRDTSYDHARTLYDDGLCSLMEAQIIPGSILNGAFTMPYFKPLLAYLVMDGRIVVVPDSES